MKSALTRVVTTKPLQRFFHRKDVMLIFLKNVAFTLTIFVCFQLYEKKLQNLMIQVIN